MYWKQTNQKTEKKSGIYFFWGDNIYMIKKGWIISKIRFYNNPKYKRLAMLGHLESLFDERIIVICPIKSHNPALGLWYSKQYKMQNATRQIDRIKN